MPAAKNLRGCSDDAETVRRESSFISIGAYDVFVEIDGKGPYMIMTHGLGTSTNVFQPLVELFSEAYTILRFDWPGLGKSSLHARDDAITVPDLINVFEGVMDHFHVQSAVLVGHSLGGIISMHMTAAQPQRVSALAVLGAGRTRSVEGQIKTFSLALANRVRQDGIWPEVDVRVEYNIPRTIRSPLLARALLRQVTASTNPEGYAQICEALCADSHVDPDYSRIMCPTCVVGGRFDHIAPMDVTDDLYNLIRKKNQSTSIEVMETGHMMIIEDIEGTAIVIKRLLACST